MQNFTEVKILICDMNLDNGLMLELKLNRHGFKNVVFQKDMTELKNAVASYQPEIIVSGNHLWEDTTGIRLVTELPLDKNAHVIVWSENINDKIISMQFIKSNLHIIKKDHTENEIEVIETIRKVKPAFN